MSYLYILEINPLSVTSFPNIFSHSVGCLFILLTISFAEDLNFSKFKKKNIYIYNLFSLNVPVLKMKVWKYRLD